MILIKLFSYRISLINLINTIDKYLVELCDKPNESDIRQLLHKHLLALKDLLYYDSIIKLNK